MSEPTLLSAAEARDYMVGQAGLRAVVHPPGDAGLRAMLLARRCVQLDPLDPIGTNADLVAIARLDGVRAGQVYDALLPGYAFEHFAKERCLLPAGAFPHYRERLVQTPWWRLSERLKRLPQGVIEAVLAQLRDHGPLRADQLDDHGAVEAMDWSGWKGTSRAATMALEVLQTRCQVVVAGRTTAGKLYDVPERALPHVAEAPPAGDFGRWALTERVEAAGLLSLAGGPQWSMLNEVRTSGLPEQLVAEGVLETVIVEGSRRICLAPAGFRERTFPEDDGRMRVLGPLDPLLWDRKLVRQAFGFEYIWEVYKPAAKRRWGWYVCPLLHQGRLVGRVEAHRADGRIVVDRVWKEPGVGFDDAAFGEAIARHERALFGG
ncbi:MAG: YcaQ family DNA glycosylase [Alphaproteobacteria bacterium]|nr:YcaQ family DNA glycosylase [Alphaproteobacteria bacterium]